jgi:hypothetical protein
MSAAAGLWYLKHRRCSDGARVHTRRHDHCSLRSSSRGRLFGGLSRSIWKEALNDVAYGAVGNGVSAGLVRIVVDAMARVKESCLSSCLSYMTTVLIVLL